jgi:uncharacterized membrane protein YhhN
VAAAYGLFLAVTAARLPAGADLTGQFVLQPAVKALTAVLLAGAALCHPIPRERRWLVAALVFSAAGDVLLAMPWWKPSFVLGLGAFLLAHVCFLTALSPLASATRPRVAASVVVCVACVVLLVWFWPRLTADGMAIPVVLYMVVLAAMACTALMADLPTPWTALGAVCFAVSDAMIGIDEFVLPGGAGLPATLGTGAGLPATLGTGAGVPAASGSEALAVPIWWTYAASLLLITAGFFFGRGRPASGRSGTPPA